MACTRAAGPVLYKRLVNGGMLDFQIAGMDFASLPPGSVIGMHDHLDTSEMWVVLSGQGDLEMEETALRIGPGQVMYTPVGGRHAMTTPADAEEPVDYIVVTLNSATDAPSALATSVVRSFDEGPLEFTGLGEDRYDVALTDLEPGAVLELHAVTAQHLLYVVEGSATLAWGNVVSDLGEGSAVGIPATELVRITAGADAGCRLLKVRVEHAAFAAASKEMKDAS